MKKYLLFIVISAFVKCAFTQGEVSNWYYSIAQHLNIEGDSGYWNLAPYNNYSSYSDRSSSTVSDSNGNLLLYTNGELIFNTYFDTLPNGMLNGNTSSTQNIIIPRPKHSNNYYVIVAGFRYFFTSLQYSLVDMSLDSGLGGVISNFTNITLHNFVTERLTAILHANGQDIWILAHEINSNNFLAYLVTPSGIEPNPVISSIGAIHEDVGSFDLYDSVVKGEMKFSSGGRKLAVSIKGLSLVELFDFDSETGQLSNPIDFTIPYPSSVEFSSDGNLLYISNETSWAQTGVQIQKIWQINILDSLSSSYAPLNVAPIDTTPLWYVASNNVLQLAWNDKIYAAFECLDGGCAPANLSIIRKPHLIGSSADFVFSPYTWPNQSAEANINGLPNFFRSYLDKNVFVTNVCFGDTTMFYTKNSYLFDSIRWEINDPVTGLHTYSNVDTVYHVYSQPGAYNVHVFRYRSTFVDDFVKKLQVFPYVTFVGQDTNLCGGGQVQLAVNSPWCNVNWYNSYGQVSTSNNLTVTSEGTYWPEVSNFWETCGDTLDTVTVNIVDFNLSFYYDTLTGNCLGNQYIQYPAGNFLDAESYLWNTGYTGWSLQAPVSGLYTLTVSGGGCSESASIYALYDEPLVVNLGENVQECDSTVLFANVQASTYLWQPGGQQSSNIVVSQSGMYSLEASNACGSYSDSVDVIILHTPQSLLFTDTAFCSGDSLYIDATWPGADYLWSNGSTNPVLSINIPGPYGLTVSNSCGQAVSGFQVSEHYPILLNLPDTLFLTSDSLFINVGIPTATYLWSDGSTGSYIWASDTGLYAVTASNACNTDMDSVRVLNPLGTDFGPYGSDVFANLKVYPNPVNETLMINCPDCYNASVSLWNSLGQLMVTFRTDKMTKSNWVEGLKIDMSGFADGLYFLVVQQNTSRRINKIIKE